MIFDIATSIEKAQKAEERIINYADGLEKAFSDRYKEVVNTARYRTNREIQTFVAIDTAKAMKTWFISQDTIDSTLEKETVLKIDDSATVPLAAFKARQTPEGVEIELVRGMVSETYISAFGPKIARLGGNIYRRAGRKRFPIVKLKDLKVKEIEGVDREAFEIAKRNAEGMLRSKMRQAVKDANEILGRDKYATA
jgi:hypothetical protein